MKKLLKFFANSRPSPITLEFQKFLTVAQINFGNKIRFVDENLNQKITGFDDTSLNTTDGNCSNSSNFVNILKGQTEGLVCGALRGDDGVKGLQERCSLTGSLLGGDLPALVPVHVGGGFNHVVAVPSGNGHESNSGGIVSDLSFEQKKIVKLRVEILSKISTGKTPRKSREMFTLQIDL